MMQLPPARVSDDQLTKLRSFKEHTKDFPPNGPPGIGYIKAKVVVGGVTHSERGVLPIKFLATIECLIYRNTKGDVIGILHHYPEDICLVDSVLEEAGSINIFVRPDRQRRGVGTLLAKEAMARWPIDWSKQRYTVAGRALIERIMNE